MTNNLNELFKMGDLESGWYFIEFTSGEIEPAEIYPDWNGRLCLRDTSYYEMGWDVKNILEKISYDEYQALKTELEELKISEQENIRLNKENVELENAIDILETENESLQKQMAETAEYADRLFNENFVLRGEEIKLAKYKKALEDIRVEINPNEHFEEINIFLKDQLEKIIDQALNKDNK